MATQDTVIASETSAQPTLSGKKTLKREKILVEAISQMNERGASFLSLNSVAVSMGLSRNTLYYYFKSRADLIYSCYLRAANAMADDLESACLVDSCPVQRIRRFIIASLASERIAISDLTLLDDAQRQTITTLRKRNEDQLSRLIQQGIERESFRHINPVIACQVLLGLLNWSQLSSHWFNDIEAPSPQTAADTIINLFLDGICRDSALKFECTINYQALQSTTFNAFDPDSVNEEKRRQLLGKASLLFNQRGIDAVSLDDIAQHIGTSKGAVYHYFKDKPSLVRACYKQAFDQYDSFIEASTRKNLTDLESLLSIGHLHSQAQASSFPPLILQPGEAVFFDDYSAIADRLREKIDVLRQRCLLDGSIRDIDSNGVHTSAGAHFWISKWQQDNPKAASELDSRDLADAIYAIISQGIKKRLMPNPK